MKCICGHDEKSHRNRPYGRSIITTWCHVKNCKCTSYRKCKKFEEAKE